MKTTDRMAQLVDLARGGDQCAAADLYKEFGLVVVGEHGTFVSMRMRADPPPRIESGARTARSRGGPMR